MSAALVQKAAETQLDQSPEVGVAQLATISLLLQYDIDNTLNAIKEQKKMTLDARLGGEQSAVMNNNQDKDINRNMPEQTELEVVGLGLGPTLRCQHARQSFCLLLSFSELSTSSTPLFLPTKWQVKNLFFSHCSGNFFASFSSD